MTVGANVGFRLHGMEKSMIVVQKLIKMTLTAILSLGVSMQEAIRTGITARIADIKVKIISLLPTKSNMVI